MTIDNIAKLKIDRSAAGPRKGGASKRRWLITACVVVTLAAVAVWFKGQGGVRIETATVSLSYPTQTFTLLNASGYVVAQRKAAVASKTTGRLEWIGVREGSRVTTGQIIARLENRDTDAVVKQSMAGLQNAQAGLEQARVEQDDAQLAFDRQKALLQQGIVARADYDVAEARLKRAKAGVSAALASVRVADSTLLGSKVNYDYSLIRAPFDAVVLTKNADEGDIITPLGAAANAKAAVVTIADLGSLQVEADVSESNLSQVKAGQPCEITLDALPNSRFLGLLQTIVPTADRTKASVMIKVRFIDRDERILPEMSARVALLSRPATSQDQQPKVTIPKAALITNNGVTTVFLVAKDRLKQVAVKTGATLGDLVEVSGVKPGDKVAISPLDKLKDQRKITMAEK